MADERRASILEFRSIPVSRERYEVAILGGGLAGLTLALQIKRRRPETSVLIVEKRDGPAPEAAFKVGESTVTIGAWYFANAVGMKDHLDDEQLPKCGLRFFMPEGDNSDITRRFELGAPTWPPNTDFQIDRGRFENALAKRCRRAGADLLQGARVEAVELGGDEHSIKFTQHDESRTVAARWVIDCSGRASLLKRELGIGTDVGHTINSAWFRMAGGLDIEEWGADDETWMAKMFEPGLRKFSTNHLLGKGYWVWLIPLKSGAISIGLCADPEFHPFDEVNELDKLLAWFGEHEPQLAKALDGRKPDIEDFLRVENFSFGCERVYSTDRWCLTGEAGVFADPFYSPGSDFIALGNTFVTDLVTRELSGEDVAERTEYFNDFLLRTFETVLGRYEGQYGLFDSPGMMPLKIIWDTIYVHTIPTLLVVADKLTDLDLLKAVREDIDRSYRLNDRVQLMFPKLAEVNPEPPNWTVPPQALMNSFIAILETYDDASLKQAVSDWADVCEAMAVWLWAHGARSMGASVDDDREVNPYAVSLDEGRWDADGLFDAPGVTPTQALERSVGTESAEERFEKSAQDWAADAPEGGDAVTSTDLPTQAPDFTLDHVLGHSVSLSDFRGRTVAVLFGGKESAAQIRDGVTAIRESFDADELPVVGISALQKVPRAARIIAKGQLKKAFEEAVRHETANLEAAGKPPRTDPAGDVYMLLDWKGQAVNAFGLSDVEHEAVGVLVDGDGNVIGSGSGEQMGQALVASMPQQSVPVGGG